LQPLVFETNASTDSAIWALLLKTNPSTARIAIGAAYKTCSTIANVKCKQMP